MRADELRQEFHRVASENRELRVDLVGKQEMLTESRALMAEMQQKLKKPEKHTVRCELGKENDQQVRPHPNNSPTIPRALAASE